VDLRVDMHLTSKKCLAPPLPHLSCQEDEEIFVKFLMFRKLPLNSL
jgi:hypothetical protein